MILKFEDNDTRVCDTMLGILCACAGASQTIHLSVLARNPHKGLVREISHETGRERGKEGPREERRTQSAEGSSRKQSAGESSQEKASQEMRAGQREETIQQV